MSGSPSRRTGWVGLAVAGATAAVCAIAISRLWAQPPGSTEIHGGWILAALGLWALAWGGALAAVRVMGLSASPREIVSAVAVSIALRVILLPAAPLFSDDLWRYLWEGRVQTEGINPFARAPLSFAGTDLAASDPFWPHVNNPEISAIYPPVAQMVFWAVAAVRYSPAAMKTAVVLADVGVLLLLIGMLRRRGRNPLWAIAWGWSPFVCFEVAGAGHLDVLAALFMLLWLDQLDRRREASASVALGLAVAAKLMPVVLLPVALRWHRRRWTLLLVPLVVGVTYLPYLNWGGLRDAKPETSIAQRLGVDDLTRALRDYETRWRHNDSLFLIVYEGVVLSSSAVTPGGETILRRIRRHEDAARSGEGIHRESPDALRVAKGICYTLFMVGLGLIVWRARSAAGTSLAVLGLFILLRPTIHPWYLLLILPLALLERRVSWFVLSVTALGTYGTVEHFLQTGDWHESTLAWAIEWGTFFPLLVWEMIRSRRREDSSSA